MRWTLTLIASAIFWSVMTVLLVRREIIPYFTYEDAPSYRTVVDTAELPEVRQYKILFGQEEIGQVETRLRKRPDLGPDLPFFQLETLMRLDLGRAARGLGGVSTVYTSLLIDPGYQLHSFRSVGLVLGERVRVEGRREDDRLTLTVQALGSEMTEVIDWPRNMTIADSFLPVPGGSKLTIGKKWKPYIMDFDFFAGGVKRVPMFASVEERERIIVEGREYDTYRVDVKRRPDPDAMPDFRAWVLRDGTVIKETLALGPFNVELVLVKRLREADAEHFAWTIESP